MSVRVLSLATVLVAACAGGNRTDPDLGGAHPDLVTSPSDLATTAATDGGTTSLVRINEVDPNGPNELTDPDWIELINLGPSTADLSTYKIRDNNPAALTAFPGGTTIPPGGYLIVWANDAMATMAGGVSMPFKLSGSQGDEVHLVAPDGTDADSTSFGAAAVAAGKSWGRSPNGTGPFAVLDTPSRGVANP